MAAPPVNHPQDFTPLSPRISLYTPSPKPLSLSTRTTDDSKIAKTKNEELSLIILCTWMGAPLRPIAKYALAHRAAHPTSCILLIQTSLADMLLRSSSAAQATSLAPAIDVIRSMQAPTSNINANDTTTTRSKSSASSANSDGGGGIVLHAFSNGGAHAACNLAAAYAASITFTTSKANATTTTTTTTLPLRALILDSAPGRASHARSVRAFSASLPSTLPYPLALLARAAVHVFIATWTLLNWLRRRVGASEHKDVVEAIRADLNSAAEGSAFSPKRVPRLYLYSRTDEMVGWEDVAVHAAEARAMAETGHGEGGDRGGGGANLGRKGDKGMVEEVVFEGSAHCAHVLEDAGRYWGAVGKII